MALACTAGPYIFQYLLFTQLVAGDQQYTCADISSVRVSELLSEQTLS